VARIEDIRVPDIGDFDQVDVIEVLVGPGDQVSPGDSLITLESDKASMEVPSPVGGVVRELKVAVGDKVGENALILTLEVADDRTDTAKTSPPSPAGSGTQPTAPASRSAPPTPRPGKAPHAGPASPPVPPIAVDTTGGPRAHASPSVRHLARRLGVDLGRVAGTGRKGRILTEDVHTFVKTAMTQAGAPPAPSPGRLLPEMPAVDFSKFGEIEVQPLHRIRRLSAASVHRSWLHVPHVTQFDDADVTAMEEFRKGHAAEAQQKGVKLTLLPFLMKASAAALREFPEFNSSLDPSGEQLVLKKYFHIGVAVDTPNGLVVPVIRDADCKGIVELAGELADVSGRARDGKLKPADIQGGCFTISSLGGIGGTAFTPIINAPEVAILGVSRMSWQPVYQKDSFVPRLMLPLSLSYDHRVIDGAAAVRFTTFLRGVLSDIRRLAL
jgi:pyruvate dehydrogenase E2 component (dihydrolipoamide acetyltransferase)